MRLIDADALKYDFGEIDDGQYKRVELYVTNEAIAQQPTIDAEPVRHGKWANDAIGVLRCSECKTQAPWKYGRDYIDYRWKANYCPNCGARMDKDE